MPLQAFAPAALRPAASCTEVFEPTCLGYCRSKTYQRALTRFQFDATIQHAMLILCWEGCVLNLTYLFEAWA